MGEPVCTCFTSFNLGKFRLPFARHLHIGNRHVLHHGMQGESFFRRHKFLLLAHHILSFEQGFDDGATQVSAGIDARMANHLQFSTPDAADLGLDLISVWSGEDWHPVAGMTFAADEASGMAVIRAEACSDGMSDRAFGLAIDLFLSGKGGADSRALRGCCALAP